MDNNNYDQQNLMDPMGGDMLNDYNDEDMLINDDNMQDMIEEGDDNYFYNQ